MTDQELSLLQIAILVFVCVCFLSAFWLERRQDRTDSTVRDGLTIEDLKQRRGVPWDEEWHGDE